MVIRLQLDGDNKYELTVDPKVEVVDIFYGSSEDGWFVKLDNTMVPFEDLHEV